jgi:hypothetical protein
VDTKGVDAHEGRGQRRLARPEDSVAAFESNMLTTKRIIATVSVPSLKEFKTFASNDLMTEKAFNQWAFWLATRV